MQRDQHERFHLRSLEQVTAKAAELGLEIPVTTDLSILGTPLTVAGRVIPNRFAAQPMEGFDAEPDGSPGPLSFRRYRRYVQGGFGLIWVEATAVLHEARSNPGQLCLHKGNVQRFAELVAMMRRESQTLFQRDVVILVQLTHSGRYSKPTGIPEPIIAHRSPILDPKHNLPEDYPVVTDDDLDRLQDTYVAAAGLAAQAGFDGIDLKSCHRYLVSELLASHTREGRYGGSLENRSRLLRESLIRIRETQPEIFITTRMNAYDAISYPYGFGVDREDYRKPDLTEPLELAAQLAHIGIPLLNISIGNPYFNPHYGRPYDFPIAGMQPPQDHPMAGMARFMAVTRTFQEARPDLPVIGGGYTWLRQFMPNAAAATLQSGGAALLGIGRGAFAYPECVRDILEGRGMDPAKCCVTCSACTQIMRDGGKTGCVVRDKDIYGPQYRLARRFAVDRLQEAARQCRNCEEATCSKGCPAHIDIPAFIKAFADNDIATSYAILRRSNLLPEMCAHVCPSEVQCEGECIENIFCEHPIPIRDIQLVVSRIARRMGLTGLKLPAKTRPGNVAVVGGGPAGIAAAVTLLEAGFTVTLYERGSGLGGTPDSIIPEERYTEAAEEIDAILQPARAKGRIEIHLNHRFGSDSTLAELREKHAAVLLAFGLSQSMSLGKAEGVMDALTFLQNAKRNNLPEIPSAVAVLGGGNTAMDAGVTALRMGARDVYLVYRRSFQEMPAWPAERDQFVTHGGHCLVLTQPLGYETDAQGHLTGLRIARTELGEPDDSGRRKPHPVEGSESVLDVGLVIEALGQGMGEDVRQALRDLPIAGNGTIKTIGPDRFETHLPEVYVAGDLLNGGTTAVQGIREGMLAAQEICEHLNLNYSPISLASAITCT